MNFEDVASKIFRFEGYPNKDDYIYASHLITPYVRNVRENIVEKCMGAIRSIDFDTLAFSGMSGVSIGMILAHSMRKEIIVARKPGEHHRAHVHNEAEGYRFANRYIIVDDFVASGITCARVIRAVRRISPGANLVGILLYHAGPQVLDPSMPTFRYVLGMADLMDEKVKAGKPAEEI